VITAVYYTSYTRTPLFWSDFIIYIYISYPSPTNTYMIPRSNALNRKKKRNFVIITIIIILFREIRNWWVKNIKYDSVTPEKRAEPPPPCNNVIIRAVQRGVPSYILQYLRYLIIDRCTPQNDSRSYRYARPERILIRSSYIRDLAAALHIIIIIIIIISLQVHPGRIIYNII